MAPSRIAKARTFMLTKPVVRSTEASQKLADSLRRLGADQRTVTKLTGQSGTRPVTG